MADPKPAYLLQGDDEVKIDGWRNRVRERALDDPEATFEMFPDKTPVDEIAAALSSMTLAMGRRWMLVEGVERWKDKEVQTVAEALGGLPADTIVVLIATGPIKREKGQERPRLLPSSSRPSRSAAARSRLTRPPRRLSTPEWAAEQAGKVGLIDDAGRRPGAGQPGRRDRRPAPRLLERRVMRELEKIAVYAPEDARVDLDTVEALTAPDVEARVHQLADALVDGEPRSRSTLAEDLRDRGAEMMHILFGLLRKVGDTRTRLGGARRRRRRRRRSRRRCGCPSSSRRGSSPRPSAPTARAWSDSRRLWQTSTTRCAGVRTWTRPPSSR